jgi:hypothetical protein
MSPLRTGAALVAAAAVLALAGGASAAPHATAAATKCDVTKVATTLGPTEVTSLTVTKTTCKTGIDVVKAYQACRLKNGVSGRCVKKVKGYACREVRSSGPTEFTATATCTKKKVVVKHSYRQTTG